MTRLLQLLAIFIVLQIGGCDFGPRHRPFGTLKLGSVAELNDTEQFFPEIGIMLRRDEGGFSAMSTHCTYDLIPLQLKRDGASKSWVSDTSTSRYDFDGAVINGPTKSPLPYYKLFLKPWVEGDPPDTLFVEVGIEVPKSWRLPIPKLESSNKSK